MEPSLYLELMAAHSSPISTPRILQDPQPLTPHHEDVVDGAHLTLRWEPILGARRYRVEIAEDPAFERLVFEVELEGTPASLPVQRHFPEDDRTFFWRVRAGDGTRWSPGDRIESFISGSAPQVGRFRDPDAAEPLGPLGPLFSEATLEAAAELLPGRQPGIDARLGHHAEGTEAAQVVTLQLGLLIAGAVVLVALLVFLVTAC